MENRRRRGRRKTLVSVDRWPRETGPRIQLSTEGDEGRSLVASGWANFENDTHLGTATLHVPGRKEPSLMITKIELSQNVIAEDRSDALISLLACAKEIAIELRDQLEVGNGCLEWRVLASQADLMLRQHPQFEAIAPTGRRGKSLRDRRLLRRC